MPVKFPSLKSAFNLSISSDIALPELTDLKPGWTDNPDVRITFDDLGEIRRSLPMGVLCWHGDAVTDIHMKSGVCARVSDGCLIQIDRPNDTPDVDVRAQLLGGIITLALLQRGLIVMHANIVEIDGKAVLCAGRSGAGKSTIAAAFEILGHKCHSDDLAAIDQDGMVVPGIPRIKLSPVVTENLGGQFQSNRALREAHGKLHFRTGGPCATLPLGAIYLLTKHTITTPCWQFEPVVGAQKVIAILDQRFRRRFVEPKKMRSRHLEIACKIAKLVKMTEVTRSDQGFMAIPLAQQILKDFTYSPRA